MPDIDRQQPGVATLSRAELTLSAIPKGRLLGFE